MYDYGRLLDYGFGVNTQGDIYDLGTGRIMRDVDKSEFIIDRV